MKTSRAFYVTLLLGFLTPATTIADDATFATVCFEEADVYFYSTDCGDAPEVGTLDGAFRVYWPGSNPPCRTTAGFEIDPYIDVSGKSQATVAMDITLLSHSGCPAGFGMDDVPVTIRIGYGAMGGGVRIYSHGFFMDGTKNCSRARNVDGIPAGVTFPYETPDLMTLRHRPTIIAWVEVVVTGYQYEALFDNICLRSKAPGGEAKAGDGGSELASWGAVKALFK
jgi:hypothetical protein